MSTTYDGHCQSTFFSGKKVKRKRGQYKSLHKRLQQKQTASARTRIKSMSSRENRYATDGNHHVTKALVERQPKGTSLVLEDLKGVRNAIKKVRIKNRYV